MKTKAILLGLTFALIPGLNRAENGIKMVVGTYTDAGSKGYIPSLLMILMALQRFSAR